MLLLPGGEFVFGGFGQEIFDVCVRAIQDNFDIGIARCPGIGKDLAGEALEEGNKRIAQVIKGVAQWSSPFLVPRGIGADMTAAVTAPAFDAMGTTPGTHRQDFHLHLRGVCCQICAVCGQLNGFVRMNEVDGPSQSHLAEFVVVAIAFTVGGEVNEL